MPDPDELSVMRRALGGSHGKVVMSDPDRPVRWPGPTGCLRGGRSWGLVHGPGYLTGRNPVTDGTYHHLLPFCSSTRPGPRTRLPNLGFGTSTSPLPVGHAESRLNSSDCRTTQVTSKTAGLLPDDNHPANRAATFASHADAIKQLSRKPAPTASQTQMTDTSSGTVNKRRTIMRLIQADAQVRSHRRSPPRRDASAAQRSSCDKRGNIRPRRAAMIAKTFIMAKEIHAIRAKSLRDNKIFRDHGPIPLIPS